jgi:transposase
MDRYIGLDVHSQSCTMAVLGPSGRRLGLRVVATHGAELRQAIRDIAGTKHVCLEEGAQSSWLYELLNDEVDELVVTVREKNSGPKDDARDAWGLAEGLRVGAIKRRVYKSQGPFSELRAALRSYTVVRDDLRRAKSRLKAIYLSRGLLPAGTGVFHPIKHEAWARQLPPAQRRSAELLLSQIQALTELQAATEERLQEASKPHRIIRTLATAPAIGPIRAAQIVATVVTPHRFRTKRQFWAYCGLAVVVRSSADWVRDREGKWTRSRVFQTRGLNQNHRPVLKEVFKGAAHHIATQMASHPLHQDYQRLLDGGMKPNLAQLTLARRLSAAVLAMWKHEEDYDPEKHRTHITAQA